LTHALDRNLAFLWQRQLQQPVRLLYVLHYEEKVSNRFSAWATFFAFKEMENVRDGSSIELDIGQLKNLDIKEYRAREIAWHED